MTGLEKATLTNTLTRERVSVQFNPEEYTLQRATNFAQLAVPGLSAPIIQFVNGSAQTVQLELLADVTRPKIAGQRPPDVRRLVQRVTKFMDIDPDLHAPPPVLFAWGSFTFLCVMQQVNQSFVLFGPDGTPLRARLKVTLTQYQDAQLEAQQIKRQTVDYTKTYVVTQGDTLALIAHREYSDATAWRAIAIRNGITDPRRLPIGAALSIPRLPYTDPRGVVHSARGPREAS